MYVGSTLCCSCFKIKFVDEANKSRVSYWSFPLVLYFKSSQGKKKYSRVCRQTRVRISV